MNGCVAEYFWTEPRVKLMQRGEADWWGVRFTRKDQAGEQAFGDSLQMVEGGLLPWGTLAPYAGFRGKKILPGGAAADQT
jgi:hypothetical protein